MPFGIEAGTPAEGRELSHELVEEPLVGVCARDEDSRCAHFLCWILLSELVEKDPIAGGAFVLPEGPAVAGAAFAGSGAGQGWGCVNFAVESDRAGARHCGMKRFAFAPGTKF